MASSEWRTANGEITKVGIVGEGKMGTNLFFYLLDFGFKLTWICSKDAQTDKILKSFQKKIRRSLDAGIIDQETFTKIGENTLITNSVQSLKGCDLVIEAIIESETAKRDLFDAILPIVPSSCILTSNSSSISPLKIITANEGRKRFAGLHFFYPVSMKNTVEMNMTDELAGDAISALLSFTKKIGKECLLLDEKSWFILNRIFLDVQIEAFNICREEDFSFHQVDAVIKRHQFPVGPFELCGSVGIEIMHAAVENYMSLSGDKEKYLPFHQYLARLISDGRDGVKSGGGFLESAPEKYGDIAMVSSVTPDQAEKICSRITNALQLSIARYSDQSGIPQETLSHAMEDYLGIEPSR